MVYGIGFSIASTDLVVDLFKMINPAIPATRELSKMLIFEFWMISRFSTATNVMKIDMVNPIPPRKPAPMICFQVTSLGN
jgi:hypothetical protein